MHQYFQLHPLCAPMDHDWLLHRAYPSALTDLLNAQAVLRFLYATT